MKSSIQKYTNKKLLLILLLVAGTVFPVLAQRNFVPAQYYFNQYLGNAAMAGIDSSLNITLTYSKQYDDMPDAPVNKLLSADYYLGKRVGVGVNIINQKSGLLNETRIAASFAYHLPLNDRGQLLHFGLSAAVEYNNLLFNEVNGDQYDPSLLNYNSRGAPMDGDFGIAFTSDKLNIQAAVPTIRNFIVKDIYKTVDRATFYSAASYKIALGEEFNSLEPKISYTMVKGNNDIWDAGLDFKCAHNLASIQAIYHSTKSFTVGLGINLQSRIQMLAMYTTEANAIRKYTDGNLSLNLKIALFQRKSI
ncbi:PorP/SprF family type IX secretion system membrane protein [Solitalea canadensis]|uniref:Bacteroidetes-specific putative membrane protein n=1 Tax=Solitalea canadensis (strain ATCC 29591 / DSM 3403 / JCM 21819 / LMG 8368 / NBRC 15130 / NCIMB 12057 / USAM 9D) TaxID=929556 RepID=H8KQG1_SOLCM|nr:PorP/SprF family type IX secretion system membrane protein [Solitalea canadensis]AFD06577.1 Bacteroidetes-specific putative membrane protein [Solitalea canadensis DSM 3403]